MVYHYLPMKKESKPKFDRCVELWKRYHRKEYDTMKKNGREPTNDFILNQIMDVYLDV